MNFLNIIRVAFLLLLIIVFLTSSVYAEVCRNVRIEMPSSNSSLNWTDVPVYMNFTQYSGGRADFLDVRMYDGPCNDGTKSQIDLEMESVSGGMFAGWVEVPILYAGKNYVSITFDTTPYNQFALEGEVWDGVLNFTGVFFMNEVWDDPYQTYFWHKNRVEYGKGNLTASNNSLVMEILDGRLGLGTLYHTTRSYLRYNYKYQVLTVPEMLLHTYVDGDGYHTDNGNGWTQCHWAYYLNHTDGGDILQYIYSGNSFTADAYIYVNMNYGRIHTGVFNTGASTSSENNKFRPEEWHQVCISVDTDSYTLRQYTDGVLDEYDTMATNQNRTTHQGNIGSDKSSDNLWNGTIDNWFIAASVFDPVLINFTYQNVMGDVVQIGNIITVVCEDEFGNLVSNCVINMNGTEYATYWIQGHYFDGDNVTFSARTNDNFFSSNETTFTVNGDASVTLKLIMNQVNLNLNKATDAVIIYWNDTLDRRNTEDLGSIDVLNFSTTKYPENYVITVLLNNMTQSYEWYNDYSRNITEDIFILPHELLKRNVTVTVMNRNNQILKDVEVRLMYINFTSGDSSFIGQDVSNDNGQVSFFITYPDSIWDVNDVHEYYFYVVESEDYQEYVGDVFESAVGIFDFLFSTVDNEYMDMTIKLVSNSFDSYIMNTTEVYLSHSGRINELDRRITALIANDGCDQINVTVNSVPAYFDECKGWDNSFTFNPSDLIYAISGNFTMNVTIDGIHVYGHQFYYDPLANRSSTLDISGESDQFKREFSIVLFMGLIMLSAGAGMATMASEGGFGEQAFYIICVALGFYNPAFWLGILPKAVEVAYGIVVGGTN